MKKLIYLLILVFIFKLPAITQTYIWFESFNSGQGWEVESNWMISGGKLEFYWSPQIPDFDLSAISPIITLPENVYDLNVTQYLDIFTGTGNEFAEIRLISSGTPVVLWNYNLNEGNWGNSNGEDLSLPIADYAGQSVQIEFRTYGSDTYNWNWWDIFEIKISAFFEHDLTIKSINGPSKIELFETGTWSLQIKNMGSEAQDEYSVQLFDIKTGDLIGNLENPGSIEPQETMTFNFDWNSSAAYNTAFYGTVITVGDQFSANNISNSSFVRIEPDIDYNIMVWDNDNGILTVVDPDKGNEIEPSKGLTNALDDAGFEYDYYSYLPENLYDYDIIFSTMGCFCVS